MGSQRFSRFVFAAGRAGLGGAALAVLALASGCRQNDPSGLNLTPIDPNGGLTLRRIQSAADVSDPLGKRRIDPADAVAGSASGVGGGDFLGLDGAEEAEFGTPDKPGPGTEAGRRIQTRKRQQNEKDYVEKADVYWKLNWFRRRLLDGKPPSNFLGRLNRVRLQLDRTARDAEFNMAEEALDHLERSVEHMQAMLALQQAGVDGQRVPWFGGPGAIEQFAKTNGLSAGAEEDPLAPDDDDDTGAAGLGAMPPPPGMEAASDKGRALEVLNRYASVHRASPEDLARREWAQAIEHINRLRDALGLARTGPNQDGDTTRIDPVGSVEAALKTTDIDDDSALLPPPLPSLGR